MIKRVDILTEKWGTLKRVAGALVYEKFTTPKLWIALDLVATATIHMEVSEHDARVGSRLMNVFLVFFSAHEVMLNSESNVQKFYECFFSSIDYEKSVHKQPKRVKTRNPSSFSHLMIRTKTSKQTALTLPKTLGHLNSFRHFLDTNSNTPEKYPACDEYHHQIFYVKNFRYYCSFCPNDGRQSLVRRDKDVCKCDFRFSEKILKMNWKLGEQYIIHKAK